MTPDQNGGHRRLLLGMTNVGLSVLSEKPAPRFVPGSLTRSNLYYSWATLTLLGRAVHCNVRHAGALGVSAVGLRTPAYAKSEVRPECVPASPALGSGFTLEGSDDVRRYPTAVEPTGLRDDWN